MQWWQGPSQVPAFLPLHHYPPTPRRSVPTRAASEQWMDCVSQNVTGAVAKRRRLVTALGAVLGWADPREGMGPK